MTLSRLKRRAFTVLAMVTAGIVVTAGTAYADTSWMTDGFENNPASRWTIWSTSTDTGGFASSSAYLDFNATDGWTEISREVTIRPIDSTHRCDASILLNASINGTTSIANIEVIDPTTWQYLALRQVQVRGFNQQNFTTPAWRNGPTTVIFRVSLLAAGGWRTLGVDGMLIACDW